LVQSVWARREELDGLISAALTGDWAIDRLETILSCILRAGAFELLALPDIPVKVIICEYVDVAGAFYAGPEPGLVNAVLDKVAKSARSAELAVGAAP
jgi:N utilization substance protein B